MPSDEQDQLLCPHCITRIEVSDHFCPKCGGVITAHASIDPIGQIHATGRAYRNAIESPRGFVVAGIWLIFGPQVVMLLAGLFLTIAHLVSPGFRFPMSDSIPYSPGNGTSTDLIQLLTMIGLLVIYAIILIRVTVGYFRLQKQ